MDVVSRGVPISLKIYQNCIKPHLSNTNIKYYWKLLNNRCSYLRDISGQKHLLMHKYSTLL